MFRHEFQHAQREFHITCSKRLAFYIDVALIVSQSIKKHR